VEGEEAMRQSGTVLAILGLALTLGCCDSRAGDRPRSWTTHECAVALPNASAALLFDAAPGYGAGTDTWPISAQNFAFRSSWPSTIGFEYTGGEAVFYREWYYDHQGNGFSSPDYVHRDFRSVRVGAKFR